MAEIAAPTAGRRKPPLIDFPANPFVALADFVVVLVLVLMLAFVHQALSSSRLLERVAVDELQKQLLADTSDKQSKNIPALTRYFVEPTLDSHGKQHSPTFILNTPRFWQNEVDGDLQRFRFDNIFQQSAASGSYDALTPEGGQMLQEFGTILRQHQGSLSDPGSGLFKRVIVEGHTDSAEGTTELETWSLSLRRALVAARALEQAGLAPQLIEVSGRGAYYPAVFPEDEPDPPHRVAENRYLDVIVVFSGERSLKYSINSRKHKASPSAQ